MSEPSVADTIAILRGIKERYETHHGVHITDRALVVATELSDRYITTRFLPDKVRGRGHIGSAVVRCRGRVKASACGCGVVRTLVMYPYLLVRVGMLVG